MLFLICIFNFIFVIYTWVYEYHLHKKKELEFLNSDWVEFPVRHDTSFSIFSLPSSSMTLPASENIWPPQSIREDESYAAAFQPFFVSSIDRSAGATQFQPAPALSLGPRRERISYEAFQKAVSSKSKLF